MAVDEGAAAPGQEEIWKRHLALLDETRDIWLGSPWATDEQERARAMFQVMTTMHAAFNIGIAPRRGCFRARSGLRAHVIDRSEQPVTSVCRVCAECETSRPQ